MNCAMCHGAVSDNAHTLPFPDLDPADEELSTREKAAVARKPAEHQALFRGNADDHFRMGIKLTRCAGSGGQWGRWWWPAGRCRVGRCGAQLPAVSVW